MIIFGSVPNKRESKSNGDDVVLVNTGTLGLKSKVSEDLIFLCPIIGTSDEKLF